MARWPFTAFTQTGGPLRDIPKKMAGAAVIGMMIGPCLGLIFGTIDGQQVWRNMIHHPLWIIPQMMLSGGIFAFSFYVCCGIPQNLINLLGQENPLVHSRVFRMLVGAVGAMLGYLVSVWLLQATFRVQLPGHDRIGSILLLEALLGALITYAIGSFVSLRRQVEAAKALAHERDLRQQEMAAAAAKAQAFALQAQIQPHFFFNTLNTVSALMYQQPDTAHEVIGRLAELFRYTLACSTAEVMPLTQELAFVENYLRIEQARFGDRLKVSLPTMADLPDVRLPGLTLQPIIENAIRYGISRRIEGGLIDVRAARNGVSTVITVRNPFERSDGLPDLSEQRIFQQGHALANVRERLRLFFGERASLEVRQDGDEWITTEIKVPHDQSSDRG